MNNQNKAIQALETLRTDVAATAENCQRQMKKIDEALTALREANGAKSLRVANGNKKDKKKPYVDARIADTALYVVKSADLDFTQRDLVRHNDLLAGFASASLRSRNLQGIWEKNINALLPPGTDTTIDMALQMAQNVSDTGLATTTLNVAHPVAKGKLEVVPVHIVRNNATDATLIVGEKITSRLQKAFAKAGIMYVDRNSAGSEMRIEAAMAKILENQERASFANDRLMDAFKYRNDLEETKGLKDACLPQAMAHRKIEPLYAKYVVKGP